MEYAFPVNNFSADRDFDAFVYPETHPSTLNYLRDKFDNLSQTLTEPARVFMQKGRDLFESFNSSEAMQYARNLANKFNSSNNIQFDNVKLLYGLNQFQNAGLVSQRWIMANPVIREMYHNQKIDGYSNTYVDVEPNNIKDNHYDYKCVMDGILQDTDDGGYKIVRYFNDLKEGDRELSLDEKSDILRSWKNLEYLVLLCKDDPTGQPGDYL